MEVCVKGTCLSVVFYVYVCVCVYIYIYICIYMCVCVCVFPLFKDGVARLSYIF